MDVSPEVVSRLATVCLALPDAYQEPAWVGTRWRVRKRTFAHVLTVEAGWPPAYALAAGTDGPVAVLTLRAPEPEVDALASSGHPYFRPRWGPDVLGVVLGPDADWAELAELLVESYCEMAPGKLVAMVDRPAG